MINVLLLIVGIFLLIASAIDLKVRAIPSIFLTGMLFVVVALNPANLFFGVLGFIIGFLMLEGDFIGGIADLKVIIIISMLISSINWFFLFVILIGAFGIVYKAVWKWRRKEKEVPFLPVFFFIYITIYLLGGLS